MNFYIPKSFLRQHPEIEKAVEFTYGSDAGLGFKGYNPTQFVELGILSAAVKSVNPNLTFTAPIYSETGKKLVDKMPFLPALETPDIDNMGYLSFKSKEELIDDPEFVEYEDLDTDALFEPDPNLNPDNDLWAPEPEPTAGKEPLDILDALGVPKRAEEAGYTQKAYRGRRVKGSEKLGDNTSGPQMWWAETPSLAGTFGPSEYGYDLKEIIPGLLKTEGYLVIDPPTEVGWESIPRDAITDFEVLGALDAAHSGRYDTYSTDAIATAAEKVGYPGVEFRKVSDNGMPAETQWKVNDLKTRRSRFAKFKDLQSNDIMASLGLATAGGVGAGFVIDFTKDEQKT